MGARIRTISLVSGLAPREITELFFENAPAPRGRVPSSSEWYHTTNWIDRAHASMLIVMYNRFCALELGCAESFLGAYREYLTLAGSGVDAARISCDRAFDLICRSEGSWGHPRELMLDTCDGCKRNYLSGIGDKAAACPFCKLIDRYAHDTRVQACFGPFRTILPADPRDHSLFRRLRRSTVPRQGTRCISAYCSPIALGTLRSLAQHLQRTNQEVLNESLIGLLVKYGPDLIESRPGGKDFAASSKLSKSEPRSCEEVAAAACLAAAQRRRDRQGKRVIAGHFPPKTWQAFQTLKARLKKSNRTLIEEALADLSARHLP